MQNLNKYSKIVTEGLLEISNGFRYETDRLPTIKELMEIITWGMKSCRYEILSDVNPLNIQRFKVKTKGQPKNLKIDGQEEAYITNLNDNVFVVANEMVNELSETISRDTNNKPSINDFCELVLEGLRTCKEEIIYDYSPENISEIKADCRKGAGRSKIGDVLAIPAKNDSFFIAVIIDKNRFGTALGVFKHTSHLKKIPSPDKLIPIKPIFHADEDKIANQSWSIIGNDQRLQSYFPTEVEKYHNPQYLKGIVDIDLGEFGAAENTDGELRKLTKEEAEEIRLFSEDFCQVYLAEELEKYLNDNYL